MVQEPWALEETLKALLREAVIQNDFLSKDESRKHEVEKWAEKGSKQEEKGQKENKKSLSALQRIVLRGTATTTRFMKAMVVGQGATRKVFKEEIQRLIMATETATGQGLTGSPMAKLLGGFGLALGLASTAITSFMGKISEAGDQYLELYNRGQTLSGSLADLWINSGKAGMTLADYTNALSEYSEVMKSLSTTTQRGDELFFDMAKQIRQTTYQMGNYGLGIGEINDYLGDYLETLRLSGHLENINTSRQRMAVQDYIVQLTELSAITGKHRKQIMDEAQQMMQTPSMTSIMQQYSSDVVRQNMTEIITAMTAISPHAAQAAQELAGLGTIVSQDVAVAFNQSNLRSGLANLIEMAESGQDVSVELRRFMVDMARAGDTLDTTVFAMANMVDNSNQGVLEFAEHLRSLNIDNVLTPPQTMMDNITSVFSIFGTLVTEALSPFNELLGRMIKDFDMALQSGFTQKFVDVVKNATDGLESFVEDGSFVNMVLTKLVELFGQSVRWMMDVLHDIQTLGFKETLVNMFKEVGSLIGDAIITAAKEAIFGDPRENMIEELKKLLVRNSSGGIVRERGIDEERTRELLMLLNDEERARAIDAARAEIIDGTNRIQEWIGNGVQSRLQFLDERIGVAPREYARGGIARQASIFGEAGPEAAIPLDSGQRIPIAELRGDFNKEDFQEMIRLLRELVHRQEMTAETNVRVQKSIDRVGGNMKRSGTIF